ncbi:MAG TPA: DNA/RNA non-specific endonuclease, partial [Myxococcota bacterium]|nr:DNA/RNA non-specific endonuclease [Myxococcota bacterium]
PAAASGGVKVRPVAYYNGRGGYNADFLRQTIPLPRLSAALAADVVPVQGSAGGELKYEHFSVVMSKSRRLAFYTAVNIDGAQSKSIGRDDEWYFDPRIPMEYQVGNDFYSNEPTVPGGQQKNYFDRGHLVRRLDPVWGDSATQTRANEDSFHWTNCSPQFWQFNQSNDFWQGLENFILTNTDNDNLKATVFTGPLFAEDDTEHRGVQVPRAYWKVVVVADGNRLYSSAYIVSQERWVRDIPFEVRPVGTFKNYQVSLKKLEDLTRLDFGSTVRNAEVFQGELREVRGLGDLKLPRQGTEGRRPFGRFRSLEDFLASYQEAQRREEEERLAPELERRRRAKKKQQRAKAQRDVVEVEAIVQEYLGTESSGQAGHQHILVAIQGVIEGDPDVAQDLRRV